MTVYEFIVTLKDQTSIGFNQIAISFGLMIKNVNGLNTSLNQTAQKTSTLGAYFNKLKSSITSVFSLSSIQSFADKVIDVRSEYEKFNTVLTNTFQSDKVGAAALNMLSDFAEKTPYALNEVTGSFAKLVDRGFLPTQDEMMKMGDLASSQGKGFDQLTDAMLDAQKGEFTRLNEFGIKASKSGDMVKLSFRGVTKEVKNNSEAITGALLQYGQMKGVSGAMDAVSKTLGGRISNLGDQWNTFLTAVGGEAVGIFTTVITVLGVGLAFLSDNLVYISEWFSILFSMIGPVITSLIDFVKAAFLITDASDVLGVFGSVMTGVLMGVNWLTTGLRAVIDVLTPFAPIILALAVDWLLWNNALAISNALMAANPVTWIVLGIMALIMVIGMVIKYTSGWGESWQHVINGAKYLWQIFTDSTRYGFLRLVDNLLGGIDRIKLGWYQFKESVGLGDSIDNQKMIAQINGTIEARKKGIDELNKKIEGNKSKARNEFSQVEIKVDTNGMKKDYKGLTDMFTKAGSKNNGGTSEYDYLAKNKRLANAASKGQQTDKNDSIVSGGSKMTNVVINIQKLQDDTKIFVESTERGIENLGEKVQEMLLRAVNSVNQMQTD